MEAFLCGKNVGKFFASASDLIYKSTDVDVQVIQSKRNAVKKI